MNSQMAKLALSMALIIVFSLILGTNSAADRTTSYVIIGVVCGLGCVLMLGKRVWWLMILFPALPFSIPGLGFLPKVYVAVLLVLSTMLCMVALGRMRLKWCRLWSMDLALLALMACIVQAFVRNPSGLAILGWEGEYVGGKEYVHFVLALLCYLTYSLIPTDSHELRKLMRIYLIITLAGTLYGFLTNTLSTGAEEIDSEEVMNGRFGRFTSIGSIVATLMLCRYPLVKIITSLWRLPLFLAAVMGVLLSGFRERLVFLVVIACFVHIVRRQYWSLGAGAAISFLVLLGLSESHILEEDVPFGVQRSLAIVPLLEVSKEARESARSSAEWRKQMWRWALDKRESYISDRVWGDGFRVKVIDIKRESILMMRGVTTYGDLELFARTGTWHSGPIECINRIGIVGLCVATWVMMCMLFVIYRACCSYVKYKESSIVMYALVAVVGNIFLWYLSAGTMLRLISMIPTVGMAKLMYGVALKEGLIAPLWYRSHYTPLMLREREEASLAVSDTVSPARS